jgi:hypothetical protein
MTNKTVRIFYVKLMHNSKFSDEKTLKFLLKFNETHKNIKYNNFKGFQNFIKENF